MSKWRRQGRWAPVAVRGTARIGSTDGGWFVDRIERPALIKLLPLAVGNVNRRNLDRAIMMFLTLLGVLLAVAFLTGLILWSDPTCCEKMYRFVRGPVLVPVARSARRYFSPASTWWFYPIMAPPDLPEPQPCRRSRPFRRP